MCTHKSQTQLQPNSSLLFWKQKRTIGSYTNKKVPLSRDSQCFFPAFLSFDETFFLNSLEQCDTDSLFATIPLWYSLFGVDYVSLRLWNDCVYNLWNITQESYSVRVQVFGSHYEYYYFLPLGWSCWPHSTTFFVWPNILFKPLLFSN